MNRIRLVICRHGESIMNKHNKFSGWTDTPLNRLGIAQSFTVANLLKNNDFIPNKIFTSRLSRSYQTSEIIRYHLQKNIPMDLSWRLNERNYGVLEGVSRSDAEEEYGKENIHLIRNDYYTLPYFSNGEPIKDLNILHNNDRTNVLGESGNMVMKRFYPYWDIEVKKALLEDRSILIVSHKHILRCIIQLLEGKKYENIFIDNGEVIIYEFDNNLQLVQKKIWRA